MTTSEIALLDTNILVYAADTTAEHYEASRELRDRGIRGEMALAVSASPHGVLCRNHQPPSGATSSLAAGSQNRSRKIRPLFNP